ncbi:beta-1,6-galactofuranosyltransferase [Fructilactobacillus fructivorans]|nr:beta-1,6-galactofuranosyltransferase [Fructilactobacillus fructivorans]KRN12942.1 beta-1,6-galactofuranosyltransferase [Fructilactobacillus fructivorans]KRN40904.1 beta-1,6-galactofuranosyltransferase [Fructilactobacillus fructivorans]KRN42627.1 beta-1,6-galactofuranosyltransferase [Fructilactobacillus fructivorans]
MELMKKLIIDVVRSKANDGIGKPKEDINEVLENDYGFQMAYLKQFKYGKFDRHFLINYRINKLDKYHLKSTDVIVIQYPIYSGKQFEETLLRYLNDRRVKTVAVIHDIDSLRFPNSTFKTVKDEAEFLNNFTAVISPNSTMSDTLRENGLNVPCVDLEIFDYFSDVHSKKNGIKYKDEITFAGNLNKSVFLKYLEVPEDIQFDVFGNIDDPETLNSSLKYMGSVSPDVLSKKLGHGYGLVWDGNSVDSMEGKIGDYLRYNNPYKASSYLSAGMPVIVWEESAIAKFVEEHHVGLAVDSIADLAMSLKRVTDGEFNQMVDNAHAISAKLHDGFYTKQAFDKVFDKIK